MPSGHARRSEAGVPPPHLVKGPAFLYKLAAKQPHRTHAAMIPHLKSPTDTSPSRAVFFAALTAAGLRGTTGDDAAARTVFATDNSIYQITPTGIVFPRDAADLKIIADVLARPAFAQMKVAMRGGGTGTNGQSLTDGVVIDCSRYMNRILEIDPVRMTARVEPGVVKDQLNKALKAYGLFFAPELSTSNRATIGGMISTDACGQGSCLYGKTSSHVRGVRAILSDGTDWWFRPADATALESLKARADRVGAIYRTLDTIEREKRTRIAEVFPRLNRFMTGYDLAHLRTADGGIDATAILCGSEGTLGMIAEAEIGLLPLPAFSALINIRYDDFNTALEDARTLAALKVASVETVDEKVLRLAQGDLVWRDIAAFFPEDDGRQASGINIAEVLADDEEELERKLADLTARLAASPMQGRLGWTLTRDKAGVQAIWTMRKRAVGLLGNVEGPVRPIPFVEDTAVPPENLAPYIREFRALLDSHGLAYGMFGHVDAGVLHVRPALDLTRPDHVPLVREISDAVVELTQRYGGVLWGEHGKGVRSQYVPSFFGDLYPCLQQVKAVFDPLNQMNPGKIATPDGSPLTAIDGVPLRGEFDRTIAADIRAAFDNAAYCNGNGACFDFDTSSPMCPSYKGTRDRRYSPKGRASLMREWLRLLSAAGIDPRHEADNVRRQGGGPLQLLRRAWNTLDPANRDDFSHEVRAAMDTCLSCKACAGQCPVKVSVPAFRARFLELYYSRYLRPLKAPLVAAIESTLPWMARARPAYNIVSGTRIGQALMRVAGLTALPALPALPLRAELRRRQVPPATVAALERLSADERARAVVFVPDAFTRHFEPQLLLDTVDLARKLGFLPFVADGIRNGKALHVHGYLGAFARTAARSASSLRALAATGVPLVGLDPSMTLAFRSEYPAALGKSLPVHVQMPQEWLAENLSRLPQVAAPSGGRRFRLLAHCTERTNAPAAVGQWAAIFGRLGIPLATGSTGCCGMAGTFGHEASNRPLSEEIYRQNWHDEIAAGDNNDVLMATGYSCRSQVKLMESRALPHPLQVLNDLFAGNSRPAHS